MNETDHAIHKNLLIIPKREVTAAGARTSWDLTSMGVAKVTKTDAGLMMEVVGYVK